MTPLSQISSFRKVCVPWPDGVTVRPFSGHSEMFFGLNGSQRPQKDLYSALFLNKPNRPPVHTCPDARRPQQTLGGIISLWNYKSLPPLRRRCSAAVWARSLKQTRVNSRWLHQRLCLQSLLYLFPLGVAQVVRRVVSQMTATSRAFTAGDLFITLTCEGCLNVTGLFFW